MKSLMNTIKKALRDTVDTARGTEKAMKATRESVRRGLELSEKERDRIKRLATLVQQQPHMGGTITTSGSSVTFFYTGMPPVTNGNVGSERPSFMDELAKILPGQEDERIFLWSCPECQAVNHPDLDMCEDCLYLSLGLPQQSRGTD